MSPPASMSQGLVAKSAAEAAIWHAQTDLILDAAGEGIYGLDLNGCCAFVNPAAARLTGHSVEEQKRELDVEELACLARCNGADVEISRGDATNLAAFRAALAAAATGEGVLIVSYDRSQLGQIGSGHFSPVGGYHGTRDLALILDVARFKYPPHWVSVERLWQATHPVDPATGRARGWLVLRPRAQGLALGFSVSCDGESWQGLAERLSATVAELSSATT